MTTIHWLGLESGVSALRTFQQSLNVVQHNIANASTEGYSRQRVNLSATSPAYYAPYGQVGRGVEITSIEQLRDSFIDNNIRQETRNLGQWEAREQVYGQLQLVFGEPAEEGSFSSVVADFWNGWQNFANDPTAAGVRSTLRDKAQTLVTSFNQINTRLEDLQKTVNEDVQRMVMKVNSIAAQIADVNGQIRGIEFAGITANDLRDRRNLLVDELNKIMPVSVEENNDGSINVTVNGEQLVASVRANEIETVQNPGDPKGLVSLRWKQLQTPVVPGTGTLNGLFEMRDEVIPDYMAKVNAFAKGMIDEINAVHRTGMGLDGTKKVIGREFTGTVPSNSSFTLNGVTINVMAGDNLTAIVARINAETPNTGVAANMDGDRLVLQPSDTNGQTVNVQADPDGVMLQLGIVNNFFSGTDMKTIALDPAIAADYNKIAGSSNGAPGNSEIARKIAGLKEAKTMGDGTLSFDQFYQAAMATLGVKSEEATRAVEGQQLVMDQLDEMRQSVSGVSIDEELVKMLEYQRGYEAAARFISVVDGLLDTLINKTA